MRKSLVGLLSETFTRRGIAIQSARVAQGFSSDLGTTPH